MLIEDFMKLGFYTMGPEGIMKLAAQGQPQGQPQTGTQPINTTTPSQGTGQKIKMVQNPDGTIKFDFERPDDPNDPSVQENPDIAIDPAIIISGKSKKEYRSLMMNSFDDDRLKQIEEIESNSQVPMFHFIRELVQELKVILDRNVIPGLMPKFFYGPKEIRLIWEVKGNLLNLCLGQSRLQKLLDYAVKEKQIKRIQGKSTLEQAIEALNGISFTLDAGFTLGNAKITAVPTITVDRGTNVPKEVTLLVNSVVNVLDTTLTEISKIPKIKPPPIPLKKIKQAFGMKDDGDKTNKEDAEDDDDIGDDGNPVGSLFRGLFTMFMGVLEATGGDKLLKGIKKSFGKLMPELNASVTPSYRASMGEIYLVLIKTISSSMSYVLKNAGLIISNGMTEHLNVRFGNPPPAQTP